MYKLSDNIYNKPLRRDEPKLKLWTSAGLLLTYNCPAACEICYYNCNPQKQGLMSIDNALSAWKSLKDLAGAAAKIHITGGEPFVYWEHLKTLLAEAQKEQLGTIDAVETNAYWADDNKEITNRLRYLVEHNVRKLKISYDPFHGEFIDYDKVRRLADIASKFFDGDRLQVRWQDDLDNPVDMKNISQEKKLQCYIESLEKHPCRFTGRAGQKLSQHFAKKTVSQISYNCKNSFLSAKGVHIDPLGNVFSGVCSGIIVGNINELPLAEIWKNFNPTQKDFFDVLSSDGPVGFLDKAAKHRYEKCRLYSGKCHLCTDLRQNFFDNGLFRPIIGPIQCYS